MGKCVTVSLDWVKKDLRRFYKPDSNLIYNDEFIKKILSLDKMGLDDLLYFWCEVCSSDFFEEDNLDVDEILVLHQEIKHWLCSRENPEDMKVDFPANPQNSPCQS